MIDFKQYQNVRSSAHFEGRGEYVVQRLKDKRESAVYNNATTVSGSMGKKHAL